MDRAKHKTLWVGLMEVRVLKGSQILGDAKGAFVNIVTWATNEDQFARNAELVLSGLGLFVVGSENVSPASDRNTNDEEIEDMLARAEHNPNAIIYGTFHTWTNDTA